MARLHIQFSSVNLDRSTDIYVIKPDYLNIHKPVRILYLLHGLTGDYSNWLFFTSIEKDVFGSNMIVVMPSAYNGFYTNTKSGINYFSFIAEELPKFIESMFNIKHTKENTFIAGLSMGGYGALKVGLTYPEKYNKIASFSGVLDIKKYLANSAGRRKKMLEEIFGNEVENSEDLFYLANNLKEPVSLYISCGKQDTLLLQNKDFHEHLKSLNINHIYNEPQGSHTWDFWDREIKEALKFFIE